MWVRKRIDVSWFELVWTLARCGLPADRKKLVRRIEAISHDNLFVTTSIRTGFDLLWSVLNFERGSEVIFSGFTIPDMSKIVMEHGLTPVPVDLDLFDMGPDIDQLRQKVNPRTRAIVVAHLWGGLVDLSQVAEIAAQHDLLLIEDCAQCYVGSGQWGDFRADISMFSFGSIKTNSALGGAVFRVKNRDLADTLKQSHRQLPLQSRGFCFRRLLKYCLVKLISYRPFAATLCRLFSLFGKSHDGFASRLAKGFSGKNYFKQVRQRPSTPLLQLLFRKLSRDCRLQIDARKRLGEYLAAQISLASVNQCEWNNTDCVSAIKFEPPIVVGEQMLVQTYWVFALLVEDPQRLVEWLGKAGFDATRNASLQAIEVEKHGENANSTCELIQKHIVYLPFDLAMPAVEVDRMIDVIRRSEATCPRRLRARVVANHGRELQTVLERESETAKS